MALAQREKHAYPDSKLEISALRRTVAGLIAWVIVSHAGAVMAQGEPPSMPQPAPGETNFSQFPGFEDYLREHPPVDATPDRTDRALLQRYRPRLFLSFGQEPPLDFYADYIAQGRLTNEAGNLISDTVDRTLLNEVKLRPSVVFTYLPTGGSITPTIYGRIDRLNHPVPMTVLTYHAVFRQSGLPMGVPAWQAAMLSAVADLHDWHQLDHYTAASIVLDGAGRPFAVMLQQHNYLRTYLIGEMLNWPHDDRIAVDVAIRSNELYLHAPGRRNHSAVRFTTPDALEYMMGFGPAPFPSAEDVTEPSREIDPPLQFLPPSDAFYMFRGFLGERRQLPGRDGPPGAFYNTLPALKPLHRQLGIGYWRHGSDGDRARARLAQEQFGDAWQVNWAEQQFVLLLANRDCLRKRVAGCVIR